MDRVDHQSAAARNETHDRDGRSDRSEGLLSPSVRFQAAQEQKAEFVDKAERQKKRDIIDEHQNLSFMALLYVVGPMAASIPAFVWYNKKHNI
jgi:hypothetical protein